MKITFLCMFVFVSQLFAVNGEAQNKIVKLQLKIFPLKIFWGNRETDRLPDRLQHK